RWFTKVEELRSILKTHPEPRLATYLEETGMELEDVYDGGRSWCDLRAEAGLRLAPEGPEEATLRRACGRLLHVDDLTRIDGFLRFVANAEAPNPGALEPRERRLLRMLVASLVDKA